MSSNSAIQVRIYPNKKQESLLVRSCLYRYHYYLALAMWWNDTYSVCSSLYSKFCEKEPDESKRKEYSRTLPWPPKKVTKEGLNDTCLKVYFPRVTSKIKFACVQDFIDIPKKGKDKGAQKNYGDIFRLNAVFLPVVYGKRIVDSSVCGWCKDNFAQAVTKTFSTFNTKSKIVNTVRFPKYKEANSFKISIKGMRLKKNGKGKVNKMYIPFLSGDYRKKLGEEVEWFDCSLSDTQLEKVSDASAMTISCKSGKWFSSVSVYKEPAIKEETGIECGIDLGIKTTATVAFNAIGENFSEYDTYTKVSIPVDKIKMLESKIDYLKKIQSRRIKTWFRLNKDGIAKGLKLNTDRKDKRHNAVFVYIKHYRSNSFKQTEERIAKLECKIANIRKNFSEQFSHYIANKCDSVGLEDLNVKGMTKNHRLARSINRVGFYKIRTAIERKLPKGKVYILNRFSPSSQVCSICGFRNKKVKNLSVRSWVCQNCGKTHDRDENAASNIRPSNQSKISSSVLEKE